MIAFQEVVLGKKRLIILIMDEVFSVNFCSSGRVELTFKTSTFSTQRSTGIGLGKIFH